MPTNYTDEQFQDLLYSEEYAVWLCLHGMDYGVVICNGDTLLDAQEKAIGFEEFLRTIR